MRYLVAYGAHSTSTKTTLDYLESFQLYIDAKVDYLHVTKQYDVTKSIGFDADLSNYDVVINAYCARLCIDGYVSEKYKRALRNFRGIKVVIVQDEYDHTNKLVNEIADIGFDVIVTCMPLDLARRFFTIERFPNTRFVRALTGYVAEYADENISFVSLQHRPITVGYRAQNLGSRYGALGFDKFNIGVQFAKICEDNGIVHDIRTDGGGRFYGSEWFDFLGKCRISLGTQSSSNVFDLDGSVQRKYDELLGELGTLHVPYEIFSPHIEEVDIDMGQISPRIFEYVQAKSAMLLYEGSYSGILEAYRHYIPLKKDLSNIDYVLSAIDDFDMLENMVERAYSDLISQNKYTYRVFVNDLVSLVNEIFRSRQSVISVNPRKTESGIGFDLSNVWNSIPTNEIFGLAELEMMHVLHFQILEIERMIGIVDQSLDGFSVFLNETVHVARHTPCKPGQMIRPLEIAQKYSDDFTYFRMKIEKVRADKNSFDKRLDANVPARINIAALIDYYADVINHMYENFSLIDSVVSSAFDEFTNSKYSQFGLL